MRKSAFTLVELLVVMAIIALLLAMLLPALGKARQLALTTKCLGNLRNMQVAHEIYMTEFNGRMIDVGLSHGTAGDHADEQAAWINTLEEHYGSDLIARSPVDKSPYWPKDEGGRGLTIAGQPRRTSYGVNNYLSSKGPDAANSFRSVNDIPQPQRTIHFLMMTFGTGASAAADSFATADHPHVESWYDSLRPNNTPINAARHVQINAHGGEAGSWQSRSNWGFLDGHAQTLDFEDVYEDLSHNLFHPHSVQ